MFKPLLKILSIDHQENAINAILEIDQNSEILSGHFPDQPVVPGASMLQIVKEVLAATLNESLVLKKADNIKFLSLVEPGTIDILRLELTYKLLNDDYVNITANLIAGETICMKLQGTFQVKGY